MQRDAQGTQPAWDGEGKLRMLMAQYGTDVKRVCLMYLKDLYLAEDAAQETFVKAWHALGSFRGESSEKTWLMHIAMNVCRDMLRTPWMRRNDRRISAEENALTEAVLRLPVKSREMALLRWYQGMTVKETARALGRLADATAVLEVQGEIWTTDWPLTSRLNFVQAMRDAGLDMGEDDWTTLSDAIRTEEERAAAADRIIDARYGDLMREEAASWVQKLSSVEGMAPDAGIVFKEQWLREHPDSDSATVAQTQEYKDAFYRYLEQVYAPAVRDASAEEEPGKEKTYWEKAVDRLKSNMTEVCGWNVEVVNALEAKVVWDGTYRLWQVSGSVSAESMAGAFEPLTEGPGITRTEDGGYTLSLLVSEDGSQATAILDKAAFRAELDAAIPAALSTDEAFALADAAVKSGYNLTESDLNRYFQWCEEGWIIQDGEYWMEIRYLNHYAVWNDFDYGVLVNITRGTVEKTWANAARTAEPASSVQSLPEGAQRAVRWLKTNMTEVYGWDAGAVDAMEAEVIWDEMYHLWQVTGSVSAGSMADAFEPVLEGPGITRTEHGDFALTLLVSEDGSRYTANLDRTAFSAE